VKWFLITGCFNDRKKGFHFSLFQFDTLHKLCDVPHHSFNNKKYLTILNHFFYTVSAPPQLFQSEPTAKRHCSTARYQGPQVVGWFTKRSQHIGLTAGTSHLKNRMAINRCFKVSLVSIHATRGIPNLLLPCYTCRWRAAPLAIASSSRLEKQMLN
jgi:hypothetical protein